MKKVAMIVSLLAMAPAAFAAELAASSTPTPISVSTAQCPLLSEGINVSLSKDVAGGYACDTSTGVIAVSTCNPNGKKNGTSNTFYTSSGRGGSVTTAADAACTAGAASTKAVAKAEAT